AAPPAHRLDPAEPVAAGRRRVATGPHAARRRSPGRDLPGRTAQCERPPRGRAPRRGTARAALGRAGRSGRDPGHVRGARRTARLVAGPPPPRGAFRPAPPVRGGGGRVARAEVTERIMDDIATLLC